MVSVEGILQQAERAEVEARARVTVEKPVDLVYDLAHVTAFDPNPLDTGRLCSDQKEAYLSALSRNNVQLVINKIWTLETKRTDDVLTAVLPKPPVCQLPRAKPIPKPKPPTKWELFARAKGITKRKKERMVWDPVTQQWLPRFGFRSIGRQREQNQWLVELPDDHQQVGKPDPDHDPFEEHRAAKKERVAKNELQRLRNLARGVLPDAQLKRDELAQAKSAVQRATASMGKFSNFEPGAKPGDKPKKASSTRRKLESNSRKDLTEEKRKNLALADKVLAAGQKRSSPADMQLEESSKRKKRKSQHKPSFNGAKKGKGRKRTK